MTAYDTITVDGGYRILMPEVTCAGHQYDDVLSMYYAKARFYDAENKRFVAQDPILNPAEYDIGSYVKDPMMLVQYLYVMDNAVNWIDKNGLWVLGVSAPTVAAAFGVGASAVVYNLWDDKGNEISIVSGYVGGRNP